MTGSMHYPERGPVRLKTHLADRPNTRALVTGAITSSLVGLDICGPKEISSAFKPLVREAAFEASELSIMTYLQARQYGKPLVLLPAVVLGRFQHDFLAARADSTLRAEDLAGKRIGVRSFTVTTVAWVRAILQRQYGVDPRRVTWVAYEDAHLAEFSDPPNVERIVRGDRTLDQMLLEGAFDAAILNAPVKDKPGLRPLIADPAAASMDWFNRFGVISINHLFVVNAALSRERPDVVREVYRMLREAKRAAPIVDRGIDILPFGVETNRRNLAFAIDCALDQGLITRRFSVDELFDDTTRTL